MSATTVFCCKYRRSSQVRKRRTHQTEVAEKVTAPMTTLNRTQSVESVGSPARERESTTMQVSIIHPHPLKKQFIARGMRVVVLSNSDIRYLANLPLRFPDVSMVSSCLNSVPTSSRLAPFPTTLTPFVDSAAAARVLAVP